MRRIFSLKTCFCLALVAALSACSSRESSPPRAVKVGKPYTIMGTTYTPEFDPHYDETGIASWYGPGFHGNRTANGERFDHNEYTAAHPTLPLPSLVRVTNLDNGKEMVVKVNDRGPFSPGRILDLSKAAATRLGVIGPGLAKVRVQYLPEDTEQLWAALNLDVPRDVQFSKRYPYQAPQPGPAEMQLAQADAPVETIGTTAPITSVAASDLQQPTFDKKAPVSASKTTSKSAPKLGLVKEAYAEEALISAPPPASFEGAGREVVLRRIEEDANNIIISKDISGAKSTAPPGSPFGVGPSIDESQAIEEEEDEDSHSDPPEKRVIAPLITDNTGSGKKSAYYVQAGTFSSKENADSLRKRLSGLGNVETGEVSINGKTLYRVRVAAKSSSDAQALLGKVRSQGVEDARVIKP